MMQWLVRLFASDSRRGLFRYFDGRRRRKIDALAVLRSLYSHPAFDWDETPVLINTGISTVQLTAFKLIGEAVRESFDIPSVEQGGLTDLGCFDLLAALRDYADGVKKNTSLFPISQTSTVQASLDMPIPTLPSGSGSTGNDPLPAGAGLPAAGTIAGSIS